MVLQSLTDQHPPFLGIFLLFVGLFLQQLSFFKRISQITESQRLNQSLEEDDDYDSSDKFQKLIFRGIFLVGFIAEIGSLGIFPLSKAILMGSVATVIFQWNLTIAEFRSFNSKEKMAISLIGGGALLAFVSFEDHKRFTSLRELRRTIEMSFESMCLLVVASAACGIYRYYQKNIKSRLIEGIFPASLSILLMVALKILAMYGKIILFFRLQELESYDYAIILGLFSLIMAVTALLGAIFVQLTHISDIVTVLYSYHLFTVVGVLVPSFIIFEDWRYLRPYCSLLYVASVILVVMGFAGFISLREELVGPGIIPVTPSKSKKKNKLIIVKNVNQKTAKKQKNSKKKDEFEDLQEDEIQEDELVKPELPSELTLRNRTHNTKMSATEIVDDSIKSTTLKLYDDEDEKTPQHSDQNDWLEKLESPRKEDESGQSTTSAATTTTQEENKNSGDDKSNLKIHIDVDTLIQLNELENQDEDSLIQDL